MFLPVSETDVCSRTSRQISHLILLIRHLNYIIGPLSLSVYVCFYLSLILKTEILSICL